MSTVDETATQALTAAPVPAGPSPVAAARVISSEPWTALGTRLGGVLTPEWLPNHYPALHGLRVIAIVAVVQIHVTVTMYIQNLVTFSTHRFWYAMDLFFFLSGFLIGSMLLAESPAGRRVKIGRFYLRRSFRILPSYYVVLTLLAVTTTLTDAQRANLPYEYAYLTNYVHPSPDTTLMTWGWSLALEEHFYLVVPLLVTALRAIRSPRTQLIVLSLLWATALPVRFAVYFAGAPWSYLTLWSTFYFQSHMRYDILIAGIFAACAQQYYGATLARWFRTRGVCQLFGAISIVSFGLLLFTGDIETAPYWYHLLRWGTMTSVAYVPLILLLLNRESVLTRALSLPVLRYIATFGYGIYLVHIPLIEAIVVPVAARIQRTNPVPWPLLWSVSIVVSMFLATIGGYLLHLLVEKPMLSLRDKVAP